MIYIGFTIWFRSKWSIANLPPKIAFRNTALSRKVTNMNGLYTISNPNTATTNEFNSDYNSFSDVEYFEVRCHFPSHQ